VDDAGYAGQIGVQPNSSDANVDDAGYAGQIGVQPNSSRCERG